MKYSNNIWRAEFDPWGNQVDGSNPLRMYQPIRMQGQHYDEESGLHYNSHRYYDPTLGRYITQDPIGLLGGWNLYRYTSNPAQEVDPLGLAGLGLGSVGGDKYCQGIGSAENYLSPEDAKKVIKNNEKMHNVYNPLGQYVHGIAVGSAVIGMAGISAATTFKAVAAKGAACIEDVAKDMIVEDERDTKKLALTCSKSFINHGSSDLQGQWSDYLIDSLVSYSQRE